MDLASLRLEVLNLLQQHALTGSPKFVTDGGVVAATDQPLIVVQQAFDQLEQLGFTTTANTHQGRQARISAKGTLELEKHGTLADSEGNGERRPARIFISHAAVDRDVAKRVDDEIHHRLPEAETFVATRPGHIKPGPWFQTIQEELRRADAYVAIITANSKDRPWILWEHGAAWMSERTFITTRVGIGTAQIPEPLRLFQIHALDDVETAAEVFRELGDDGQNLDRFCEEIAAIAAATPQPEAAPPPSEGVFLEAERVMPKLLAEMRADVRGDESELVSEFVILPTKSVSFPHAKPQFVYYEDEHAPYLLVQVDRLEEMGAVFDVTPKSTKTYRMGPEFIRWLRTGN